MPSPSDVLGVDDDADRETVERAYRERVKEVHPDAGGSTEAFKRVQAAYRALTDEETTYSTAAGDAGADASSTSTGPTGTSSSSSSSSSSSTSTPGGASASSSTSNSRDQYVGGGSRSRSGRDRTSGRGRQRQAGTSAAGAAGAERGDRTRQRQSADEGPATGTGRSRRWFLYGLSAIAAGALWQKDEALTRALGSSGSDPGVRRGSATRDLDHDELFPVGFEASAGSTVRLTVDGADTRDWVYVYTERQYEWVRDNWVETGEFDPGNPLETVLTDDGYVAELPRETTYVVLVKLWRGPPEETRTPRTVEVTYEIRE